MGEDEFDSDNSCPYLTNEEDFHQTTIFPKCTCDCACCDDFKGYCPIKDQLFHKFIL